MNGGTTAALIVAGGWLTAAAAPSILLEPADGAGMPFGVPHLRWSPAGAAAPGDLGSQVVQIAADDGFGRVVDEDVIAAVVARYVPDRELAPGRYWWRVATLDGRGERGDWSVVRTFTVRPPERVVEVAAGASFAEIRRALGDAAAGGPAMLRFAAGAYRLDPGAAEAFIELDGARDLVVDGGGATFTFTGFVTFVRLRHCERVMVRNCTFDFDPLPYTAGRVLAVDRAGGTLEVEIAPGHPLPESNPAFERDKKGMIVDPAGPFVKRGVDLVVEHAGWRALGGRRYRFAAARPRQAAQLAPGDVYVLDPRIRTGFDVDACNEVTFYQLDARAVANEAFNSHYANRHHILHCGIRLLPGRFIAANNGGHNHHNARIGPWIEGCTWENTGDDICHVNCLVLGVAEQLAADRVRLPLNNPFDRTGRSVALDVRQGDLLQFYHRAAGRVLAERRVTAVAVEAASLAVVLDGPVDGVVAGRPMTRGSGPGGVHREEDITQVFNLSRACNQFVFRHNVVRNGRRVGVLAKGVGGLIEHNCFEGLGGGAVEFWNAPFEGPGAESYVVRSNRISGCGRLAREHAAIWATAFRSGADHLHRRLTIIDNTIEGFAGPAMLLRDVRGGVVHGNRISLPPGAPESIVTRNVLAVEISGNVVRRPEAGGR